MGQLEKEAVQKRPKCPGNTRPLPVQGSRSELTTQPLPSSVPQRTPCCRHSPLQMSCSFSLPCSLRCLPRSPRCTQPVATPALGTQPPGTRALHEAGGAPAAPGPVLAASTAAGAGAKRGTPAGAVAYPGTSRPPPARPPVGSPSRAGSAAGIHLLCSCSSPAAQSTRARAWYQELCGTEVWREQRAERFPGRLGCHPASKAQLGQGLFPHPESSEGTGRWRRERRGSVLEEGECTCSSRARSNGLRGRGGRAFCGPGLGGFGAVLTRHSPIRHICPVSSRCLSCFHFRSLAVLRRAS